MSFPQSIACVLTLLSIVGTSIAGGPPVYNIRDIGNELDSSALSATAALNEDGDAVGEIFIAPATQAFVETFEHGPMLLPLISGLSTARAVDVSDRDSNGDIIIIGTAGFSSLDPTNPSTGVGCYWIYSTETGQVLESGQVGPLPGETVSRANGLNNHGQVVGFSNAGLGTTRSAILFDVHTQSLTTFVFPTTPVDINNLGQVAGGRYIGDLAGNSTDLGMPADTTGASIVAINDQGWVAAGVGRPFTDGAGRFVQGVARYTDSWRILWSNSAFDTASDLNENGDVVGLLGISAAIRPAVFFEDQNGVFLVNDLIGPMEVGTFSSVPSLNTNKQLGVGIRAAILTPLGTMIIPGDVNGDADVTPSDLCDFLDAPIDLDGDGDTDQDDEQWLIERLETLGFVIDDCNMNGIPDPCDVLSGFSADCNGNFIPDECEPDCDGDGLPDDCESDCNENGIPDECDISDGTSDDCNGNGVPDECDSSDLAEIVTDYAEPLTLFSNLPFDDALFATRTGTIDDVDVVLDMNFRVGQVTARLSHAGVTVTLIDRPGETPANPFGFTNLGYRITLDDEGAGTNIQATGASVSEFDPIISPPSYKPANPLNAFDGLPREGVWTLELELGIAQTFDPKLIRWGVLVTDTEVPIGECACEGDCTADGVVDFADLVAMLIEFGNQSPPSGCDADASGDVNFADLVEALVLFGPCD